MSHLTAAEQQYPPPDSPAPAPTDEAPDAFLMAFDRIAQCVPGCISVGSDALDRGNRRRAAEYVIGILDDLAPELAVLRAALTRDP